MLDDAIEVRPAEPDSQYRLRPCRCKSDNVAYVKYAAGDGEKWKVRCFDCGHTVDKGDMVRHDAQRFWNEEANVS